MPIIGFTVFREKIENGEKQQTIRRLAVKRPICPGDLLFLYWKLRTKECQPLQVPLGREARIFLGTGKRHIVRCTEVLVKRWVELMNDEDLAKRDGFDSVEKFREWFTDKHHPKPDTVFAIIRW